MRKPPVVHLSTVHIPTDTRIFHKEARTLAEAGYPVTVVAPASADEEREGVNIRALQGPNRGMRRFTRTNPEAYRLALTCPKETIFHVHDPELLFTAFALKRRGYRVIYDVHEETPLWIRGQHWIPAPARAPLGHLFAYLERRATRVLDGIVVATPPTFTRLSSPRTVLLRNFPLRRLFAGIQALPYTERPFLVTYIGGLSEIRGIREMVQAMDILARNRPARLYLGGVFYPPALREEIIRMPGWAHVHEAGWVDREQVLDVLGRARVGLAVLHPERHYRQAYPTKVFEYMAAGIPVVATDMPLIREVVVGTGAGLLVDPYRPEAIAEAVAWLFEHPEEAETMGRRGREAFLQQYNWESESRQLLALYERIAQAP